MKLELTSNQCKMIGVISMVLDHIGYFLFPECTVLRMLGRIAFPIFSYFTLEGFLKTHNWKRYLGNLLIPGVLMSIVTFGAERILYGNVFLTLGCSVLLLKCIQKIRSCFCLQQQEFFF